MEIVLLAAAVFLLAYFNGANDNFKGAATLLGTGTADYRRALLWVTLMTLLGSVLAAFLTSSLLEKFSGRGLVAESLVGSPSFALAVLLGAAATILVATLLGLPVSTTHALIGGLLGASLSSAGGTDFGYLASEFFTPLLASPLLAILGTGIAYPIFRYVRLRAGVDKETCVCVGSDVVRVVPLRASAEAVFASSAFASSALELTVASHETCIERYRGRVLGVSLQSLLDHLHYASAGAVSFARGLNDTPKIVALLAASGSLALMPVGIAVGVAMAAGGLLQARKVAETMSYRVTGMNHGQGFTANLITSSLVILASRWGLPVSTTHVSCGALFGIGMVTGQARYKTIAAILLAWGLTLPVSALFSFVLMGMVSV